MTDRLIDETEMGPQPPYNDVLSILVKTSSVPLHGCQRSGSATEQLS